MRLPLNDPRVQDWDEFDIEFYEYAIVCDDPVLLKRLENHYEDTSYDAWEQEFEQEQKELREQEKLKQQDRELDQQFEQLHNPPEPPDSETITWSNTPNSQSIDLPTEEYEMGTNTEEITDWVKEE